MGYEGVSGGDDGGRVEGDAEVVESGWRGEGCEIRGEYLGIDVGEGTPGGAESKGHRSARTA